MKFRESQKTRNSIAETLSSSEKALFLESCYWYKHYDDSNPDVGFGPSPHSIVDIVAKRAGIKLKKNEVDQLANELRSMFGDW